MMTAALHGLGTEEHRPSRGSPMVRWPLGAKQLGKKNHESKKRTKTGVLALSSSAQGAGSRAFTGSSEGRKEASGHKGSNMMHVTDILATALK